MWSLFKYGIFNGTGLDLSKDSVEAGMLALREKHTTIGHDNFIEAITVVAAKKKENLNYFA